MARRLGLLCGILSSVLYVAMNIAGAMMWEGYRSISQSVSELSAVDAPSRPIAIGLGLAYNVALMAFSVAVWRSPERTRALRVVSACLMVIAAVGVIAAPFGSMHLPGEPRTASDTLHIALTVVTVAGILIAVGSGATAFGPNFRRYSIATLAVFLVFGIWAGLDGPRVAANLPTPWIGLTERINIGAHLLWVAVLAVALLRRKPGVS